MLTLENCIHCTSIFKFLYSFLRIYDVQLYIKLGGVRGAMVIVVGNGHGNMSSNPGRD